LAMMAQFDPGDIVGVAPSRLATASPRRQHSSQRRRRGCGTPPPTVGPAHSDQVSAQCAQVRACSCWYSCYAQISAAYLTEARSCQGPLVPPTTRAPAVAPAPPAPTPVSARALRHPVSPPRVGEWLSLPTGPCSGVRLA